MPRISKQQQIDTLKKHVNSLKALLDSRSEDFRLEELRREILQLEAAKNALHQLLLETLNGNRSTI